MAATVLLILVYLAIAAALILGEHEAALLTFKAFAKSESFFRLLFFLGGLVVTYLSLKLYSLIKGYLRSRRAEGLAIRLKFQETQKGWLDYRVESEKSSKRLHVLNARMARAFKVFVVGAGFIKRTASKKPSVTRAHATAYLFSIVINKSAAVMEANLEELHLTTELFIETTEGHLKTCRQDYGLLDEAHEYFKSQLKEVRESANALTPIPPAIAQCRGISQDLTAAANRLSNAVRTYKGILRRIEGHCARMARLAQSRRDRVILKPLKKIASALLDAAKTLPDVSD